jgi:hypothetical protein
MHTHFLCFQNLVLCQSLRPLKDRLRHALGCGTTVGHIVLDTKVVVRATGVMACGEQDTTVSLVFPNDIGRGGGREDTVLADDELRHTVGCANLADRLDHLVIEISTVTANNDCLVLGRDGVKDGLYKVLRIVLSKCVRMI